MYNKVYRPIVSQMHVLATDMKAELEERTRQLAEVARTMNLAQAEMQMLENRNLDVLVRSVSSHVGTITCQPQDATVTQTTTYNSGHHSLALSSGSITPSASQRSVGSEPARVSRLTAFHLHHRPHRKPVFDVRMPSIVKDTRFTRLTPLKTNQKVSEQAGISLAVLFFSLINCQKCGLYLFCAGSPLRLSNSFNLCSRCLFLKV